MREREVVKLQEGDVITCNECPKFGCDGKPTKVRIENMHCGCVAYYHERNMHFFLKIMGPNCRAHAKRNSRWGVRIEYVGWDKIITGRSIKLVNKAPKKRGN